MIPRVAMDHNSASSISRYLAGLLALSLALQPSVSYGIVKKRPLPQHVPAFEGQAFEGVNHFARPLEAINNDKEWSEYLSQRVHEAEMTNIQKVNASGDNLVDIMVDYKNFFAESLRKIDADIDEMGYEYWFKYKLDKNEVNFTDPFLGKMEFTNVDGEPVAKVVHEKSGVAFLIYDEERVSRNSKHFQQYIARQHYDAGSTRKDSKYRDENGKKRRIKYGRDTLIMGINPNPDVPDNVEVTPRKRGIKHWWRATFKRPDKKEAVMGFVSGVAQFASVWALAEMVGWVLPGYEAGSIPAMLATFTLAYGSLFGIFNSFYQNWRVRGPQYVQSLKNMSVSLSYYFGVSVITTAGLQEITLHDLSIDPGSFLTFAQNTLNMAANVSVESILETSKAAIQKLGDLGMLGVAAAIHPFHNFLANNEFKNWTVWRQRLEELERRDLHNVSLPIPFLVKNEETDRLKPGIKHIKTPMTRRFWNRQFLYYLPVNWTKFVDQALFTASIGPAITGDLPWWTPLVSMVGFWGITTAAIRHTNWLAYEYKPELHRRAAIQLKIRQNSLRYYPERIISHWIKALRHKRVMKRIREDCSQLLVRPVNQEAG